MEKLRTLTLALAALATLSGLATATTLQQQSRPTTVKSSKSNGSDRVAADKAAPKQLKGTVTEVNDRAKTFTVQLTFSAPKLSTLPTAREIIDITYTETPGGGPMEATTIKSSKSNGSEGMAADNASPRLLGGTVTEVDTKAKTFIVKVTVSAAKLPKLPTVGQVVHITYTEPPGGGPLEASNLNLSKSNIN